MGILPLKPQDGQVSIIKQPQTRIGNVYWVIHVMHIAFRLCDYVMLMHCLSMQQLEMHHLLTGSLMLHDIPVHLPYQGTQAAKGRRYGVELYLQTHTHSYSYSFALYSLVSADADNTLFCTCYIHISAKKAACNSLDVLQCVCVCEPVWHWCCRVAQPRRRELYLHEGAARFIQHVI